MSSRYSLLSHQKEGISLGTEFLLSALGVAIVLVFAVLAGYFPVAFLWATYEDLIGEWFQFYLFFVSAVLSVIRAAKGVQHRLFFAVLGLACGFVSLEEISWGQRLFGFSSPYVFEQYNLQNETNVHNFLTGPFHTPLKVAVEIVLAGLLMCFGVVYPWALNRGVAVARIIYNLGIPAPSLGLSVFFAFAAVLELGLLKFNEAEIAEILVGSAVLGIVFQRSDRKAYDWFDALNFSKVLAIILLLAVATTLAVYSNDRFREAIDSRLYNGKLKFARKYESIGWWSPAIRLYEDIYRLEPHRMDVLERLADCYLNAGMHDFYNTIQSRLLEKAMTSNPRWKNSIPGLLSVAASFSGLGNTEQSRIYENQAITRATDQAKKFPRNAIAAYWLGKAYAQAGRQSDAVVEFERALKLEPKSKKYKHALFLAKSIAAR